MSDEQEEQTTLTEPTPATASPGTLARASVSLVHDLRGPLVTIDGFGSEMRYALEELEALLAGNPSDADVVATLRGVLKDDLQPCLKFVLESSQMLHARIDALALPHDDPTDLPTARRRKPAPPVDEADEQSGP